MHINITVKRDYLVGQILNPFVSTRSKSENWAIDVYQLLANIFCVMLGTI